MHLQISLILCLTSLTQYQITFARPINQVTQTQDLKETQIPSDLPETNLQHNNESKPTEVQKAVCTVTSGDVRASAEAFTTRELKGVCGSDEMLTGFGDLEKKLTKELQDLRKLINDLHQHFKIKADREQLNQTEISVEPITSSGALNYTAGSFKFQPIPNDKVQRSNEMNKNYYVTPKFKSLETKGQTMRDQKISKFNNTLRTDKDVKVYTYYWRMENVTKHLRDDNSISMESPIFTIKGKTFKIKAHFQHLHRDFLYLQLEDYTFLPQLSLGNSIILDTGGIFKQINSEKFKYKISILDQNKKSSSDLVSQEFESHENGFLIPNSALIDSPFIKNETLLIQISLYL